MTHMCRSVGLVVLCGSLPLTCAVVAAADPAQQALSELDLVRTEQMALQQQLALMAAAFEPCSGQPSWTQVCVVSLCVCMCSGSLNKKTEKTEKEKKGEERDEGGGKLSVVLFLPTLFSFFRSSSLFLSLSLSLSLFLFFFFFVCSFVCLFVCMFPLHLISLAHAYGTMFTILFHFFLLSLLFIFIYINRWRWRGSRSAIGSSSVMRSRSNTG